MTEINFARSPTRKELRLYRRWAQYLSNSRLSKEEVHKRASLFANQGRKVPND